MRITTRTRLRLDRVVIRIHHRGTKLFAPDLIELAGGRLGPVHQLRAGGARLWPVLPQGLGHRADPVGRDHVARERRADELPGVARIGPRGQRIVDGDTALGEVAVQLPRVRSPNHGVVDGVGLVALDRRPEEGLVLDDRPADRARVQVEVGVGLLAGPRAFLAGFAGEVGQGTRRGRPGLPQEAPVPGVRARLARHVEDAAAGAPHLRVVGGDLDLDFLHRLERGDDGGAVAYVDDGDAVERVVVPAPRSAPQGEKRGVGLVLLPYELR